MPETRFVQGTVVMSRFDCEWELLGEPDCEGYVFARRKEDGKVRPIHTSDIKCIVSQPAKA